VSVWRIKMVYMNEQKNQTKSAECDEGFRPLQLSQKYCSLLCYKLSVKKRLNQLKTMVGEAQ
jgi:hypothetical protein